MKHLSDAQLIHITLAGNRAAFGILVERYHEMVLRVAYRTLGQTDVAQDMAQEALLQAFLSLKQLHDPSRFRSWLYGITLNVCRDFLRMQRVNLVSFEALAGGVYIADDMPSPETIAEQIELRQTIQRALQTLTEANRSVVMLHYYEGFSTRDIAEVLEISVSAVKVRLHKARQQLRTYLEVMLPTVETQHEGVEGMIPVTIADVRREYATNEQGQELRHHQVILFDERGRRALVIWIGEMEAFSITMGLSPREKRTNRPMTHQFLANLLQASGAIVESVEISKIEGDVYYAVVRIKTASGAISEVDARPSDALAMAVWNSIPVFANEKLLNERGILVPTGKTANRTGVEAWLNSLYIPETIPTKTLSAEEIEKLRPEKPDEKTLLEKYQEMAQTVVDATFE